MKLTVQKSHKGRAGSVTVSDANFAARFNESLVHQVLTAYTAGARRGTKVNKNRAAVRGGGRKPWRQKGLGRARAGTIRNPIWRGGGVTFAAKTRDFSQKVNRKMYRGAMRSILSELVRQERLICVDSFALEEAKTKNAIQLLANLGLDDALIVTDEVIESTSLAVRNIPGVDIIDTSEIDPYTLIGFEKVVLTKAALEKVEAWLS